MQPAFIHYRKIGDNFMASKVQKIEENFIFTRNYPQHLSHVTIAETDFVAFQMNQTVKTDGSQKIVNHNRVSYLELTWAREEKNCVTLSPQLYAKVICKDSENCRLTCRRKYRFNKQRK